MRISDWSSDVCSSDLLPIPGKGALDGELGLAIGVDWTLRVVFRDGRGLRHAVDGGGRGEDERPDPGRHHGIEEAERLDYVVGVVECRIFVRFAEIGRASCRERVCQYV